MHKLTQMPRGSDDNAGESQPLLSEKRHKRYDYSYRLRQHSTNDNFVTLVFTTRSLTLQYKKCWYWFEILLFLAFCVMSFLSGQEGMEKKTKPFTSSSHCEQQGSWHRTFFAIGSLTIFSIAASTSFTSYPCMNKRFVEEDDANINETIPSNAKGGKGKQKSAEKPLRCREDCLTASAISGDLRIITTWFFNLVIGTCVMILFIISLWGLRVFRKPWIVSYARNGNTVATTFCDSWGTPLGFVSTIYLLSLTSSIAVIVCVCPVLDKVCWCPCSAYYNNCILRGCKNSMSRYNDVATKELSLIQAKAKARRLERLLDRKDKIMQAKPNDLEACRRALRIAEKLLKAYLCEALAEYSLDKIQRSDYGFSSVNSNTIADQERWKSMITSAIGEEVVVGASGDRNSSLSTILNDLTSCPIKMVEEIAGSAIQLLAKLDDYAVAAATLDADKDAVVNMDTTRTSKLGSVQKG